MKEDRFSIRSRCLQRIGGCALALIAAVLVAAKFHEIAPGADRKAAVSREGPSEADEDGRLRKALMTADPVLRRRLLRQWADEVAVERMKFLLECDPRAGASLRREMRLALLSSWVARDSRAAFAWAGGFAATDAAYGETRDLLVEAVCGLEPELVLAEIGSTLPAGLRREVSMGYFRHWADRDPAAAAGQLLRLSTGDAANAALWDDLIPQVAAQWIGTEPDRALFWIQGLPEGPVKANAEIQSAYRWAELEEIKTSEQIQPPELFPQCADFERS